MKKVILLSCFLLAMISCKKEETPAPVLTNTTYLTAKGGTVSSYFLFQKIYFCPAKYEWFGIFQSSTPCVVRIDGGGTTSASDLYYILVVQPTGSNSTLKGFTGEYIYYANYKLDAIQTPDYDRQPININPSSYLTALPMCHYDALKGIITQTDDFVPYPGQVTTFSVAYFSGSALGNFGNEQSVQF